MLSTVIVRSPNFRRKSLGRHHGSMINRDLPDEVVIQILQRLPEAKSVIRCKLVCRNWYRIISAATFIRRFLNHHHHHNFAAKISHFVPQSHRLQSDYFPVFILPPEQLINKPPEKFNPFLLGRKAQEKFNFTVVASCNDLLLCRLGSETEYCICNPLTKQYTTLPPSPKFIREEDRGISYVVGFSCNPYVKKNREGQVTFNPDYTYRVVLVYNCFKWNGTRIHDFSSETNEWRVINPRFRCDCYGLVPSDVVAMWPMIFCNGMGFYVDWEKRGANAMTQICIYNPQNSTLRTILAPPLPHTGNMSQLAEPALGVCRGVLRFFRLLVPTEEEAEEVIITAKVWELDGDEQWRLVHNVYLHQLGDLWHSGVANWISRKRIYYRLYPIAIDPNDADIVYIRAGEDRDIVSCNLREMEMKHIQGPFVEDNSVGYPLRSDVLFFPVMAPLWPTPIRLPIAR